MNFMLSKSWSEIVRTHVGTSHWLAVGFRADSSTRRRSRDKGRRRRQALLDFEAFEARIAPATTVTTLASTADPSIVGQVVTFTATVKTSAGIPVDAGTVAFLIDGTTVATVGVSTAGQASLEDSNFSAGTYTVSADYTGNDDFENSDGSLSGGQVIDQAPAITSAASATFTTGVGGKFTVTATGFPAPALSVTSGTSLASLGLTFNASTGVLAGTPAPGTGGAYGLIFTASNGIGTSATQGFTLDIDQPPAITSAVNTTFVGGSPGTFTVTASGNPTPSLSESGTLPGGITFDPSTGILSGTPATTDPGGVYTETLTASNGVGSDATQSFFLVVDQPPAITSADNTTFVAGVPATFTVTATGSPAPTLSESGTLPGGITFDPTTGLLSGTPATTDPGGVYTETLAASNGVGSDVTQSFFLVIEQPPAITSPDSVTFVEGVAGSFAVTATGSPVPTLAESGTLPGGLDFDAGSSVLSGTPAPDTSGTYDLTFTARNGAGSPATQAFVLNVVSSVTPTTTRLTSSPDPAVYGQPVTFTATVAPAAGSFDNGGAVTFEIDGDPGTDVIETLKTGVATFVDSALLPGSHGVQATYSGDSNFAGSTGSESGIEVVNHPLAAPTNFVVAGVTTTSIAFGWTDNDASATSYQVQEAVAGSMIFTPLAGSPFGPGASHATAAGLVSGTSYQFEVRAVSAVGVSQWLVSDTIETPVSTTTSLTASPNPLVLTQTSANTVDTANDITFTATVMSTSDSSDTPNGQVDFQDTTAAIDLGTVPLIDGVASLYVPAFDVGGQTIVATFAPYPASIFVGSENSVSVSVDAATDTTVNAAPSPGILGQPVAFTAIVDNQFNEGGTPTGSVQFQVDGVNFGQPIDLDKSGQATISDPSLALGNHDISATFTPTGYFTPSQGDATEDVDIGDTWTGNAGDHDWDTPGNWSNGVPLASDDVYLGMLPADAMINLGPADNANNLMISSIVTLKGGALSVGGMLTDTASLTLAGGAKLVNLQALLQNVTVMAGSQFSVQGRVLGNLINDGELDMGDTVGALVVTGNYTQGEAATLSIVINGLTGNEIDRVTVGGTTTLSGGLSASGKVSFNAFGIAGVIGTANPILGDFTTVTSMFNGEVVNLQALITDGGLIIEDFPVNESVSVTSSNEPQWQPEGPAPIESGQTNSHPDNGQEGAISSVLVTPDGTVYVGTVNGGVWSSTQVTPSWVETLQDHYPFEPANFWVPLTDSQPSLAVSTMALDPSDPNNTLWVGTGSLSSYFSAGGPAVGILKTTDGGQTWVDLAGTPNTPITGVSNTSPIVITTSSTSGLESGSVLTISGVTGNTAANGTWTIGNVTATTFTLDHSNGIGAVAGSSNASWSSSISGDTILSLVPSAVTDPITGQQVVLVGTNGKGLLRSTDGGANFAPATFHLTSGAIYTNLGAVNAFTTKQGGVITALVADPTNPGYFYAAVNGVGIFESYNNGADWFEIDESTPQITNNTYFTLAVAANPDGNTNLFVATAQPASGPWGAAYSGLLAAEVSPVPLATIFWVVTNENSLGNNLIGSAVGSPGHFYLAVSPSNPSQVFIGGPVQLLDSGIVSSTSSSLSFVTWSPLSGSNGKPHDDQRDIAFLSDGTILATNDGGIYALLAGGNHWVDLNENIQDTEFISIAYDAQDGAIFGGSQDNGTEFQTSTGSWDLVGGVSYGGGDGGEVAVDNSGSQSKFYLFSDGHFETHSSSYNAEIALQGLNSTDQQTITNANKNPPDASFIVAVNPFGPAPGTSTGLAPILIGGGTEPLTQLYESYNGGATVNLVSAPTASGNPSAFTYASAAGAAYYGTQSGQLFTRTGYGATFTPMPAPNWGNAFATQIVTDPKDPQVLYVLDNFGNIWGSIDHGAFGWTNLTAGTNLAALDTAHTDLNIGQGQGFGNTTTTVQSIQLYDPSPYTVDNNVILAGALGGVYSINVDLDSTQPSPYSWSLYGQGIPDVQVSALDYIASADLLVAGTFGRGAWEITSASTSLGMPDQTTVSATGGTILLQTDPARPGYGELLSDVPGVSLSQVIADDNVQLEEQWSALTQLTIAAESETVDIVDVPQGVSVTIDGGNGTNTVNVGSAANQLVNIAGTVSVGTGSITSQTSVNINDQGDTAGTMWTIGGGSIAETPSLPGTISFQDVVGVVINAASTGSNTFIVNDTSGTAALTLHTGSHTRNLVVVFGTSYETTLTIDNQGASSATTVTDTAPQSETFINDSATDSIELGQNPALNTGVQSIQGNISISTQMPDSDTLNVDDRNDSVYHQGKYAVTVTNSAITGLARGTISFGPHTLSSLLLEADGEGTIWNIQGTPIPYTYFENSGGGLGGVYLPVTLPVTTGINCSPKDQVNVGDPTNGLQDIFGTLDIFTPTSAAAVVVNLDDHETTYPSPTAVSITNTSVSGLGPAAINFGTNDYDGTVGPGGVSALSVMAGTGGTAFTVADMNDGPTTVTLTARGMNNSIVGPNSNVTWTFQGHINFPLESFTQGSGHSTVNFNGIQAITGGSGANDFVFSQTGFNGTIDGGSSGDSTLDFRKFGGSSLSVETLADGSLNGVQGTATEGTTFDDIDTVLGDPAEEWWIGNTTAQDGTYQGNFTHVLTVAGFANMELNVAGDFSGELIAPTEGTAANPISQINVSGTVDSGAMIKVRFLLGLDVEGDLDGIIKGFGVASSVATIQTIIVDGTVGLNAEIVAHELDSVEVQQDFAGILSETSPTADFDTLTVGGSVLSTALIDASSGGAVEVTGDFSGEVVIAGALETLTVGGMLDGTVSAGTIGSQTVSGPITGQIDIGLSTAPPVSIGPGDVAGLIQAIDQANFIGEPSIINLAASSTYLLTAPDNNTDGPNGLPAIMSDITINGDGAVIEGDGATPFRILYISSGANLVLAGVTIEDGSSTSGGGVFNAGTLKINDDNFTENSATGNGGAVFNAGTLTQTGTSFSNNSAGGAGPNVFNAVAPTPTTTTLTDNGPDPSTAGQSVTFTVSVSGGVPDGEQVTLEDASNGDAVVGTGSLTSGTASVAITDLSGGTHDILALYAGDLTLSGSESSTLTQNVDQAPMFTSAADDTFTVGASDSFSVSAAGYLAPTLGENSNDVLPSGVTFDPATGILSGTPALGTVGIYTLNFTAGNGIGLDASQAFTLTVGQATPVINWTMPGSITYGTPLDGTELDATANVPGTFVYAQPAGTVLPAMDTPLLAVTFTPDDTADYATVTQTVPIEVNPAPLFVYADSQIMTYGSAVPALLFTATGFVNGDTTSSVSGSLATVATSSSPVGYYDITLGTLGSAGASANGIESNYAITYYDAYVSVIQAMPTITWAPPSDIDNQTPLGNAQLDATASVAGTFDYSEPAGTVLSAGTQTLYVTFTPDDESDELSVTSTVLLTVDYAAAPTVTTEPSSQSVSPGGTAILTAAANGGPTPSVQWQVNSGGGFAEVTTGGVYNVDAFGDLFITGATTTMNGDQYQAVFTNNSGSVTTSAATLNVTPILTTTGLIDYGPFPATTTQSISLAVTVSGNVPDGETVAIEDASNGDAVVPTAGNVLADGAATITVGAGALGAGVHNLFAVYGGDGTFAASRSPMLTQTVNVIVNPSVTLVSPSSGPMSGGTTVTISGSNLASATAVDFGGTGATILSISAAQIVAVSPMGTAGVVDITVVTPGGTSPTSSADHFTYVEVSAILAPVLTQVPAQSVDVGQTFQLNLSQFAADPNTPPLPLTYILASGAPAGASINQSTGVLTWILASNQQIGNDPITVLVADNGTPARTVSETFTVRVIDPGPPPTVSDAVVSTKKGLVITLTYSELVNSATAGNPANYLLTEPARKPKGAHKPARPPLKISLSVSFNQAANQVTLKAAKKPTAGAVLTLTVIGTGPAGIAKLTGLQLAGGGQPGTNYIATIKGKRITPTLARSATMIIVRDGVATATRAMNTSVMPSFTRSGLSNVPAGPSALRPASIGDMIFRSSGDATTDLRVATRSRATTVILVRHLHSRHVLYTVPGAHTKK
jgi:hypothetical protein